MPITLDGTNGITTPTYGGTDTSEYLVPVTAFKNRIINGAMMISQRGTSFSTPAVNAYTLDRWIDGWAGAAPASIAQVAGIGGYSKALQITGAAGNTAVYVSQRIESNNTYDLAGQNISIQATIAVSSAQTVKWELYYPNAQDNYSGATLITSGTWSATSTATTFTATISNLTANSVNGLWLVFYPNNGGAFTSGTMTVTGVQLEKGSTATSFDYRPYGTELALCQRYYEVLYNDTALAGMLGVFYTTNAFASVWYFKQEKRATATLSRVGGSWFNVTPTLYNGISTGSAYSSVYFYVTSAAGVRVMEASAEL